MLCLCKILIIYLLIETGEFQDTDFERLERLAKEINVTSERIDDHKSNVYINDNKYEIFFYDPVDSSDVKYHTNTSIKFYTSMNCEFATWTRNELFKVVKMLPVAFYSKLTDVVYQSKFTQFTSRFNSIVNKTNSMINILFNVTESIDSSIVDKSLLVALLDLSLKLSSMATYVHVWIHETGNYKRRKEYVSDPEVLQLVLKPLNAIELFMSLNCEITSFYNDVPFKRHLIDEPDGFESMRFIRDIVPLNLDPPGGNHCSLYRMLLGGVLDWSNSSELGAMKYVEISVGCSSNALLKYLFDEIQTSTEIEVIFWYQNCIMKVISYFLCDKMKEYLSTYETDGEIPTSITESFRQINSVLFSGSVVIPSGLIDCFELFASKTKLTGHEVNLAKKQISLYLKDMEQFIVVGVDHTKYIYAHRRDTVKRTLSNLLANSLEEYLSAMVSSIEEFKCFMQLYKSLNDEFYSYYAPFVTQYEKIVDFVIHQTFCRWTDQRGSVTAFMWLARSYVIQHLDKFYNTAPMIHVYYTNNAVTSYDKISENPTHGTHTQNGCSFIMASVYFCYDIVRNRRKPPATATVSGPETFSSTFRELSEIRKALLAVAKIYPSHHVQKIAYQLIPYFDVVFGDKRTDESSTVNDSLVRIAFLVVNVLNYYALEYCYPPTYDFVMFNELNVIDLGRKNVKFMDELRNFTSSIDSSKNFEVTNNYRDLETVVPRSNQTPTERNDPSFGDLADLFKIYDTRPETHRTYEDAIYFEWNGKHSSVGAIHAHIVSTLVRPIYFYSFFDILLKFYLATIYREINVVYEICKSFKANNSGCHGFKVMTGTLLKDTPFPDQFLGIVGHLNDYLSFIYEEICETTEKKNHETDARDVEKTIIKHFRRNNVFVYNDGNSPETDVVHRSVTRPVHYTDFAKEENSSLTEGRTIFSVLKKMIEEFLESVKSIMNVLKGILIYTT